MTQNSWRDIDPYTTSGIVLSQLLNDGELALHTQHRGATRPAYVETGMIWIKEVNSTLEQLLLYDGTDDLLILRIILQIKPYIPCQ